MLDEPAGDRGLAPRDRGGDPAGDAGLAPRGWEGDPAGDRGLAPRDRRGDPAGDATRANRDRVDEPAGDTGPARRESEDRQDLPTGVTGTGRTARRDGEDRQDLTTGVTVTGPRARLDLVALGAVLVAFVGLALAYQAAMPPFEGPDAGGHFGYIAFLRNRPSVPRLDAWTCGQSHELVQQPPLYYALSALVTAGRPLSPTIGLYVRNPQYGDHTYRVTATLPGDPGPAMWPLRQAAGVAMLGGLLTVLGTWALARRLLPEAPLIAVGAAAAVALDPQFLAASATVSNDTWAAATVVATVVLALSARSETRAGPHARRWLMVGVLAGLAALTKYSGLAVLPLVAVVAADDGRRRGWRRAARAVAGVAAGWLVVAGWWYAVQLVRHGSPLPVEQMLSLLPDLARDRPATLGVLAREATWLPYSYWGVFGHGVVAPSGFYRVALGLSLAGLAGLAVVTIGAGVRRDRRILAVVAFLGLWLALVLAGVLAWMRLMVLANQGRLLFPAAPAIGLLLAIGWLMLVPERHRRSALAVVVTLLGMLGVWGLMVIEQAYALPPDLAVPPIPDRPIGASFDGGMRLVGADLPNGATVVSGGTLPVTLYFQAEYEISDFAVLFAHLTDPLDRRLAGFDGVPAGGRHATRQWVPGAVFADSYRLDVAHVPTDTLATLSVGFYDATTRQRRAVRDARGTAAGDRVVVGPVRVARAPAGPAYDGVPLAEWAGGIVLAAADVAMAGDSPSAVAVAWAARAPVLRDYTVFVQLLDRDGRLVTQIDRQPQGGAWPTSTWVSGYTVRDIYRFDQAAPSWDRLILGLYDGVGDRLPLVIGPDGAPSDHFVLRRADRAGEP